MSDVVLHDYWRSSAAYRVRIVLNLKGVEYRAVPVDLTEAEQTADAYRAPNPQGLVPALEIDGLVLTQSLAIIDYLDANFHEPKMVSADPAERARTLAQALVVAADIHPVANLRVLNYLRRELCLDEAAVERWVRAWIASGLEALEVMAPPDGMFGGDTPNLADVCPVPQMYNARRFGLELAAYPRLVAIDAAACAVPEIAAAAPEAVRLI